jgi:hypothetical protein
VSQAGVRLAVRDHGIVAAITQFARGAAAAPGGTFPAQWSVDVRA